MSLPLTLYQTYKVRKALRRDPTTDIYSYVNIWTRDLRGYRQKPPYNVDTWCLNDVGRNIRGMADSSSWAVTPLGTSADVEASNKARAKFVGNLGDASQLGSTLTAELHSSWNTVSGGVTNALLAANAVRRGRILEAGKILGFTPPEKVVSKFIKAKKRRDGTYRKRYSKRTTVWVMPDGKQVSKSLGNKWLWYSYGVKPLIDDIYNACDVFVREVPSTKVVGFGSGRTSWSYSGYYQSTWSYKSSYRITALVRVDNPNLWLANQLGLINPAQWFLEGVKLSFVVDWFSNLSQVVQQFTDFAGLKIERPITTSKHSVVETFSGHGINDAKEREIFRRELSIPEARLRFAYERFQWQRGLNAISLLVGYLKK